MPKPAVTPHDRLALQVIDRWLGFRLRHVETPGLQICIRKKGRIVFSKAYGVSNTATGRTLQTTDLFHLASQSKMYTGCAILMLQEQGRLNLTDKLVKHVPRLRRHTDVRVWDITIRDLLSHRSGLFRDGLNINFWSHYTPFPDCEKILKEVLAADLIYDPNTQTKYSNIGYGLLGLIIETVTGQSYAAAIDTLIFTPLKTKRLRTDYAEEPGLVHAHSHSKSYDRQNPRPLRHVAANALAPATGFCGTAEDASLFLHEFLHGRKLITKDTQTDVLSLQWPVMNGPDDHYGLGVSFLKKGDKTLTGHGGNYLGSSSRTCAIAGTDLIVSIAVNNGAVLIVSCITFVHTLLKIVHSAFKAEQTASVTISPILMTPWGEALYMVGPDQAVRLNPDAWNPLDGLTTLKHVGRKRFMPQDDHGYNAPGEAISFVYKNHEIIGTRKYERTALKPEAQFFETAWPGVLAGTDT